MGLKESNQSNKQSVQEKSIYVNSSHAISFATGEIITVISSPVAKLMAWPDMHPSSVSSLFAFHIFDIFPTICWIEPKLNWRHCGSLVIQICLTLSVMNTHARLHPQ